MYRVHLGAKFLFGLQGQIRTFAKLLYKGKRKIWSPLKTKDLKARENIGISRVQLGTLYLGFSQTTSHTEFTFAYRFS